MSSTKTTGDRGLWSTLAGDGRPLLSLYAVGLGLAGAFAWFVSAAGETLPHELRFLAMTVADLHRLADGRVAAFMVHDRVAFGGTLMAVAVLTLWLIHVPLAAREQWSWRLIAVSGALGFGSFLAWLGYGFFDLWHAVATAALLPLFVVGLELTRPRSGDACPVDEAGLAAHPWPAWRTAAGAGRGLLLLTGIGMVVAGATILTLGTVVVFVPQDTIFLGFDRAALDALNPRLVPLIAHDRAGFGGGLLTVGVLVLGCAAFARPTRSLWELVAGSVGFGAAIGIHGVVGYLDPSHVGPAVGGALVFALGMVLTRPARRPRSRTGSGVGRPGSDRASGDRTGEGAADNRAPAGAPGQFRAWGDRIVTRGRRRSLVRSSGDRTGHGHGRGAAAEPPSGWS